MKRWTGFSCVKMLPQKKLSSRHLQEGSFVFYDLTSLWYEGKHCPLAKRGYSRDGKRGKLQIELGLLCDIDGRPIAVEVFEGSRSDPTTVSHQIEKLRHRFKLDRVVIVGDRGMLTEARINNECRTSEGLGWVSALRGPAIRKLMNQGAIQLSLFDEQDLAEIKSPDYPDERLVVCRNPFLAHERKVKRQELLLATEKELKRIAQAVHKKSKPLRGKQNIALRVGKIINKYKVAKHFKLTIEDDSFGYRRLEDKIKEEALLDGFYIVRTSVDASELSAEQVVLTYKRLSVVERAFRFLKTVDLKVRPIYHRLENRVRAHVFLCMLAYYTEWEMRNRLKPLLFDDESDSMEDMHGRDSVVQPTKRSSKALSKASLKCTAQGDQVHSFHTALDDLATICCNTIEPDYQGALPLTTLTEPTAHQQKMLDILGVKL